jgi:hypothetical protein
MKSRGQIASSYSFLFGEVSLPKNAVAIPGLGVINEQFLENRR